jgi:hypothetical protein
MTEPAGRSSSGFAYETTDASVTWVRPGSICLLGLRSGERNCLLAPWVTAPDDDERDQRTDADQDGGPDVQSQTEHLLGSVDTQHLDPHTTKRVEENIQPEYPTMTQPEATVEVDEEEGRRDVPDHLVEERRVEQGAGLAGDPGVRADLVRDGRVDLQAPRERGRRAEELLVEPVAEPPDRLGEQEAGCERVGERREADLLAAAADVGTDRAQRDRPPDPEATVPDPQRLERVVVRFLVWVWGRDDVVEPTADDAERHGL